MSEPTILTLAGMKCPKCGSLGPIDISEIYASAVVRPDGTPEGIIELSNFRCDPAILCTCKKCEYRGMSKEFCNVEEFRNVM